MGLNTIGATGVGLPPPQALYPVTIYNAPQVVATNRISLPPGGDVLIPPGTFFVSNGIYSMIQVLDPVTQTWTPYASDMQNDANPSVSSDGVNFRIINPTGTPIGAYINASGIGYTSAPTITASAGASTWLAIIGGGIGAINATNSGLNYAVAPIVNIAAPPAPGIPATAVANLGTGGVIASFTITNIGAGYTSAPAVVIVPQNSDVNAATSSTTAITNATAVAVTSYVGCLTGVLLTNKGTPLNTTTPALTFAGGGASTQGAATALMAWTISAVSATAGSGYGQSGVVQTFGGQLPTSGAAPTNNAIMSTNLMDPRNANILATVANGAVSSTTIIDGGLFMVAPSAFVNPGPLVTAVSTVVTASVVTLTVSGINDTIYIQPI